MKVKDLPKETLWENILLRMPDNVFEQVKEVGLETQEVIFSHPYSGPTGYWVKTLTTGNRVFPVWDRFVEDVFEWEVIRMLK